MEEVRKNAYRVLLYQAMLEIRAVAPQESRVGWRPSRWLTRRSRRSTAGDLANWLHDLAAFAAADFEGFDEDRIWREHDGFLERHRPMSDYKRTFHRALGGATGIAAIFGPGE